MDYLGYNYSPLLASLLSIIYGHLSCPINGQTSAVARQDEHRAESHKPKIGVYMMYFKGFVLIYEQRENQHIV